MSTYVEVRKRLFRETRNTAWQLRTLALWYASTYPLGTDDELAAHHAPRSADALDGGTRLAHAGSRRGRDRR